MSRTISPLLTAFAGPAGEGDRRRYQINADDGHVTLSRAAAVELARAILADVEREESHKPSASKFRVERLPPRGLAMRVVEGQPLPDGVAPTWPAPGQEPEGWTPFHLERPFARGSHREIWELHAEGYPYWFRDTNGVVGVRVGFWIVTDEHGHTEPMPNGLFQTRYRITGPA